MSNSYPAIDENLAEFIRAQRMFFVATAPNAPQGHVNVSPKGYDSLVIIDPNTVAYLDLGGSGIETMAHVRENGRITLMFCAYEGKANIVRLYGRGDAFGFDDPGFDELLALFPKFDRARAIIRMHVDHVTDACGWGIPFYEFKGEREQLRTWVEHKQIEAWKEHRYVSNAKSIDGLPGLVRPK